jgi:glycosyltransferase involved in cell wall biosynthesis
MAKLEIVMFNMSSFSEWEAGVVNRNFHVFRELLKRSEVERLVAVDFIPFTKKRTLRNFWENILHSQKGEILYKDFTTLFKKIDPTKTFGVNDKELFVYSTIDSVFSQKLILKIKNVLTKKLPKGENVKKIIWSYFPMLTSYFDVLPADLFVFDAVDNWLHHPSYKPYQNYLKQNYKIIAQKSDLIFTVAESLGEFFRELGREKDIFWVANGVDFDHFQKAISDPLVPDDIKNIPRPIIGYLGIIQQRVDTRLLEYIASNNPDKSLVLIGPTWPVFLKRLRRPAVEIKRLKRFKNVYFLGRRPYSLTPYYIREFNVAIIPHRLDEFIKYTYSLKLLEYLSLGKAIVSTPPSGVEKFSHLIYIAQDYRDFNEKIQKALAEKNENLTTLRMTAAKDNDWRNRVGEMTKYIESKLFSK